MFTVVCCLLIADFLTGVIHWIEDTYGDPRWPIIGPAIIEPNILHHQKPGWFATMSSFVARNYQPIIPALFVAVVAMAIGGWSAWPIVLIAAFASLGNEVHAWNHRGKNPWWIRLLQDAAIIQTPKQHAQHHRKPYDRYFCTLTNVTNAVLEAACFWRGLEWLIATLFGVYPKRGSPIREGV